MAVTSSGDALDFAHSDLQRSLAQELASSKSTIPHYSLSADISLDALLALRERLNAGVDPEKQLSLNDFLIKAAGVTLRRVPEMNSSWFSDTIRTYHFVDINVTMATASGILTPVVQNADAGLNSISSRVRSLVDDANAGAMSPDDLSVGTFTMTNLGAFGVRHFTPIIRAPQAGSLAVGAVKQVVVPNDAPVSEDGEAPELFKLSTQMTATLVCDHRVVDGAVGAKWISEFKGFLENPETMLL